MENTPSTSEPKVTQDQTATGTADKNASGFKPIKLESVPRTSLKSSQEKNFKKQILDNIPAISEIIDKIWPKKASIQFSKMKNYSSVYFVNEEPCFVQKDEAIFPHIRLLHKYPFLLPTCQVDKGAIPFIIGGANVMIPGMTSKGGILPEVNAHSIVAILCEGKVYPLGIGRTTMSKSQMQKVGKGIGLELLTYVGDENWNIK